MRLRHVVTKTKHGQRVTLLRNEEGDEFLAGVMPDGTPWCCSEREARGIVQAVTSVLFVGASLPAGRVFDPAEAAAVPLEQQVASRPEPH